jgi:MFS family permease
MAATMSRGRRHGIIAALGISQIFAWGASYYLPAILAKPIVADTGWPLAWVVGGFSLGLLVAGFSAIRVGHAIERHGGRPVLAASVVLLAAGLVLLATAPNLAVYFLAWAAMGVGMAGGLYDAAFSTLGRIFGADARRAITHLTLWGGFASTVCWPISAVLVESFGWRGAALAYAAFLLLVVMPLHLFVLPREERRDAGSRTAAAGSVQGETPPERHRLAFAILATMMTVGGTIMAVWSVHIITILEDRGFELAAAVVLGALVGPAQVGGRVLEMLAGGRHHPMWTLLASVTLVAAGLIMLWLGFALPAVALLAYGAGNGIWSIARGTVPLALFGSAAYAVLMGRLAKPSMIAQSLAPSAGAFLLDATGATATLGVLAALACLNVAGVAVLQAYARPRPS